MYTFGAKLLEVPWIGLGFIQQNEVNSFRLKTVSFSWNKLQVMREGEKLNWNWVSSKTQVLSTLHQSTLKHEETHEENRTPLLLGAADIL